MRHATSPRADRGLCLRLLRDGRSSAIPAQRDRAVAPVVLQILAARPDAANATTRGGCVVNRALVETMDWDAVRAWLDR
jgi:hypothetical protein